MHSSTSGSRNDRMGWLGTLVMVGLGFGGLGMLNLAGCPKPSYPQMFEGVNLRQVMDITQNTETTDAEKTEALAELGIEDEQIAFLLINAPMPSEQSE